MTAIASSFATKFAGIVITPDGEGYDKARAIWNGTAGVRPALTAHCRTADDIIAAASLTRAGGLPVAVRGGGHSVAGLSTCERGVVTGLPLTRKVTVRPERRAAIAEPGATWADYDAATAAHGLASTGGLMLRAASRNCRHRARCIRGAR
jgi:FAD/FMN-containing dehydrogenase